MLDAGHDTLLDLLHEGAVDAILDLLVLALVLLDLLEEPQVLGLDLLLLPVVH